MPAISLAGTFGFGRMSTTGYCGPAAFFDFVGLTAALALTGALAFAFDAEVDAGEGFETVAFVPEIFNIPVHEYSGVLSPSAIFLNTSSVMESTIQL